MHAQQHPEVDASPCLDGERVLSTTHSQWFGNRPLTKLFDFAERKSLALSRQLETLDVNDLKARGWTKAMIAIYLSESDIAPNSGLTAGRPKQLYYKSHILAIEAQASFIARLSAAEPRRCASNALFNEKTERLVNLARSYKFQVPDMPLRQLRILAKDKFGEASLPSQDLRNQALYLIEQIESACSELAAFHWSYGVRDARLVLRRRIYVGILDSYPHLSKTIFELGQETSTQFA